MGLIGHGIVFGLGYMTGRPEGRQRLLQWRDQALELTRRPEVKRLRDRGWNVAEAQATAATRGLSKKLRGKTTSPAEDSTEAGTDSATAAADLHAALAGNRSPTEARTPAPGVLGPPTPAPTEQS